MAKELKPSTAAGYSVDVTSACERTLVTLLSAFGTLKDTLRLVGGLVPRYLTPERPPEVPAHAGTSDVDIVLNLEVLAADNEYASLSEQLKVRGFSRWVENNVAVSWRWKLQVDERTVVVVELLRDAGGDQPGRAISVSDEKVSALTIKHARIVHDWYRTKTIAAEVQGGGGMSIDEIRFADVPAFTILKALACDQRSENKDAADLIHVLRYAGSITEVSAMFVDRIRSKMHPEALQDGFAALKRRFCDDEFAEGFQKTGSVSFARFQGLDDEDDQVREQRFAAGLIQAILDEIANQLTTTSDEVSTGQLASRQSALGEQSV